MCSENLTPKHNSSDLSFINNIYGWEQTLQQDIKCIYLNFSFKLEEYFSPEIYTNIKLCGSTVMYLVTRTMYLHTIFFPQGFLGLICSLSFLCVLYVFLSTT